MRFGFKLKIPASMLRIIIWYHETNARLLTIFKKTIPNYRLATFWEHKFHG